MHQRNASEEERRRNYLKGIYTKTNYSVDGETIVTGNYNTDDMFAEAVRFSQEAANEKDPFFLFLSPFAPHAPYVPAERHAGLYKGLGIPDRPNLDLDKVDECFRERDLVNAQAQNEMMLAIDEGLGNLLDALEEAKVLEDTMIILTSDNGILFGEHGDRTKNNHWEEAIRVPFIVRYKPLYQPGTRTDRLVSLADVLPTLVSLGGGEVPKGLYGQSFLPGAPGRESTVSLAYDKQERDPKIPLFASLVEKDLKLTVFPDERGPSLFKVSEDPYELNDLAALKERRADMQRMKEELHQILTQHGDPAEAAMVNRLAL